MARGRVKKETMPEIKEEKGRPAHPQRRDRRPQVVPEQRAPGRRRDEQRLLPGGLNTWRRVGALRWRWCGHKGKGGSSRRRACSRPLLYGGEGTKEEAVEASRATRALSSAAVLRGEAIEDTPFRSSSSFDLLLEEIKKEMEKEMENRDEEGDQRRRSKTETRVRRPPLLVRHSCGGDTHL